MKRGVCLICLPVAILMFAPLIVLALLMVAWQLVWDAALWIEDRAVNGRSSFTRIATRDDLHISGLHAGRESEGLKRTTGASE